MAYMEWNREWNTGIEVIDSQHMRIVDYINRLQDVIESRDREAMTTVFEDLVDYTVTHFTFEEGLQEEAGYQFLSAHRRVHQVFTKKLREYQNRFEEGDLEVAHQVNAMLRTWLVSHIRNDDADYVESVSKVMESGEKKGLIADRLKKLFG